MILLLSILPSTFSVVAQIPVQTRTRSKHPGIPVPTIRLDRPSSSFAVAQIPVDPPTAIHSDTIESSKVQVTFKLATHG